MNVKMTERQMFLDINIYKNMYAFVEIHASNRVRSYQIVLKKM